MEFTSAEHQSYQINVWMFGEKNHSPNITGAAAMGVDNRYLPAGLSKEDNLFGLWGGRGRAYSSVGCGEDVGRVSTCISLVVGGGVFPAAGSSTAGAHPARILKINPAQRRNFQFLVISHLISNN